MKTLLRFIAIAVIVMASCKKSDPGPQMGCMTGVNKSGYRAFLRCCTHDQYLAGDNVNQGGTAGVRNYTDVTWVETSDCSTCK